MIEWNGFCRWCYCTLSIVGYCCCVVFSAMLVLNWVCYVVRTLKLLSKGGVTNFVPWCVKKSRPALPALSSQSLKASYAAAREMEGKEFRK